MEARTEETRFSTTEGTCQGGEAYHREHRREKCGLELNGCLFKPRPLAGLKYEHRNFNTLTGAVLIN